jgi:hypothetical protein
MNYLTLKKAYISEYYTQKPSCTEKCKMAGNNPAAINICLKNCQHK